MPCFLYHALGWEGDYADGDLYEMVEFGSYPPERLQSGKKYEPFCVVIPIPRVQYFRISFVRDKNKWGKLSLLLILRGAAVRCYFPHLFLSLASKILKYVRTTIIIPSTIDCESVPTLIDGEKEGKLSGFFIFHSEKV